MGPSIHFAAILLFRYSYKDTDMECGRCMANIKATYRRYRSTRQKILAPRMPIFQLDDFNITLNISLMDKRAPHLSFPEHYLEPWSYPKHTLLNRWND